MEKAQDILKKYDRCMVLQIFVDSNDITLKEKYNDAVMNHNNKILNSNCIDAGFDLFSPVKIENIAFNGSFKLDLNVICSATIFTDTGKKFNTGYYLYPRSSIVKSPFRLGNSCGIIDAGYRGHLIAIFDVITKGSIERETYCYERFLQICAPSLIPIIVEIVSSKEELGESTSRGENSFGSSGR